MNILKTLTLAAFSLMLSQGVWAQWETDASPNGNMRFSWIHGSLSAKSNKDVRIQVHRYNEHTYILRQNPAVHWEAPFMYLLFGDESAVLLDAGATSEPEYFPLRQMVDSVIDRWKTANRVSELALFVIPLGQDSSQTSALEQFRNRKNTRIADDDDTRAALFGSSWPDSGTLSLGGRHLEVIPTPGIDPEAISLFDTWSKILLTGNTFYPGRLIIRDHPSYLESLEKLQGIASERGIVSIWGGRIEMSAEPGLDYMLRSNYRPNERSLQLESTDLKDALDIVRLINDKRDIQIHDDFIVMNGVGRGARAYGWPVYIPEMFRKNRTR